MLEKYHVASDESQAVLKYSWNKSRLVIGGPRSSAAFVREVAKVFGGGSFRVTQHGNAHVTLDIETGAFWGKLEEAKEYWTISKLDRIGRMLN